VYKPKIIEEKVEKMDVDTERTTSQDIIQIGMMDIPVENDGNRPVVLNDQVGTSAQKESIATSDHKANGSGSNSKYFQPRCCPPGLTHTQRRKLQCLRLREKREKELEE
jgi:sugar/nucleoside kinase (ribokinase family)